MGLDTTRPEPSKALEACDALADYFCKHDVPEILHVHLNKARRAISQPAPAVPESIRQLPQIMRDSADMGKDRDRLASDLRAYANDIDRALAQPSELPAVPDGYVLVPKEPTQGMMHAGTESLGDLSRANSFKAGKAYQAMVAAAPTHPADGDSPAVPNGHVLISRDRYECIKRGIELLEQSATPFDEACSLIRGAVFEAPTPTDGDKNEVHRPDPAA